MVLPNVIIKFPIDLVNKVCHIFWNQYLSVSWHHSQSLHDARDDEKRHKLVFPPHNQEYIGKKTGQQMIYIYGDNHNEQPHAESRLFLRDMKFPHFRLKSMQIPLDIGHDDRTGVIQEPFPEADLAKHHLISIRQSDPNSSIIQKGQWLAPKTPEARWKWLDFIEESPAVVPKQDHRHIHNMRGTGKWMQTKFQSSNFTGPFKKHCSKPIFCNLRKLDEISGPIYFSPSCLLDGDTEILEPLARDPSELASNVYDNEASNGTAHLFWFRV